MRDEFELLSRPIQIADILAGVRFATAFNSKGFGVSVDRRSRRCKRYMGLIVLSAGHRPRNDGAITLSPISRALEDRYGRVSALIEAHCALCPLKSKGQCDGWSDTEKE